MKDAGTAVSGSHSVVFFDGECNFCNRWVTFIHYRDHRHLFRFASLQSTAAERILAPFQHNHESMDSIVLVEDGRYYKESTAVLRIFRKIAGPYKYISIFIVLPEGLRNAAYRFFAKRRYKYFGRQEACELPSQSLRESMIYD
ncbi:hypothetical protein D3C78_846890 [compost metagenome]